MERAGGSFKVGRLWGIDVEVHVLFVALAALVLLTASDPAAAGLLLGVLFGSVFLHELGHCFGARVVGGRASAIVLWPLGGFTRMRIPKTAKGEFVSTAAGPAVNLLLGGAGVVGILTLGSSLPLREALEVSVGAEGAALHEAFLYQLTFVNLLLFVFNVLPAYPMDGGRLLRSMLWPLLGWRSATLAASGIAIACAVGLAALGVRAGDLLLVIVAGYIGFASWNEFRRAKAFRPLPKLEDDLMPHERR